MKQFCPKGHNTFKIGRNKNYSCKQCARNFTYRWNRRYPKKVQKYALAYRKKYRKRAIELNWKHQTGIFVTYEEYTKLLKKQKKRCKICKVPQKRLKTALHLDHCHKTKRVRGLLCGDCNRGLGIFKDSPILLQKAIKYLLNLRQDKKK